MDISESGSQIGEKLFALLDADQRKELKKYICEQDVCNFLPEDSHSLSNAIRLANPYYFYNFPWSVVLGYLLFLIFVQVILTAFMTNSLKQHSLVERIRAVE